MANKNKKRIYREFKQQLFWLSDYQLIQLFNERVGAKAWGSTLLIFVKALLEEIQGRDIDLSRISKDPNALFAHSIFLRDKEVLRLNDFNEEEAFLIISSYLYEKLGIQYKWEEGLVHWTKDDVYFLHKATNTEISFPSNRIAKDKEFDYRELMEEMRN